MEQNMRDSNIVCENFEMLALCSGVIPRRTMQAKKIIFSITLTEIKFLDNIIWRWWQPGSDKIYTFFNDSLERDGGECSIDQVCSSIETFKKRKVEKTSSFFFQMKVFIQCSTLIKALGAQ